MNMPKANVVLADGTKVTIDGTTDEVAAVLERISRSAPHPGTDGTPNGGRRGRRTSSAKGPRQATSAKSKAKGPADYIRDLVGGDFFNTKRGLRDVQQKLEEGAHIYEVTTISPALFRLVRTKELRRIKEEGTWKYVNP